MCGRYYPLSRGKTEPSMPSTILATNSLHTAPACSLSMLSLTNTTLSEGRYTASSKSSSRKGRGYRKAFIAIFHLSNPYPSKCYKTPEHLFRLSPSAPTFLPVPEAFHNNFYFILKTFRTFAPANNMELCHSLREHILLSRASTG